MSSHQPTQRNADFAVSLLSGGYSVEEVKARLVERGINRDAAAAVVIQALYEHAAALLNSGLLPSATPAACS